jgi:hypothetical protein
MTVTIAEAPTLAEPASCRASDRWHRWPHFDDEQIAAAAAVLRSGKVNYWTGEEGRAFEREFARTCACAYGIALANGTVALELALHVLGIGPGDEVVVTPRSFVASAGTVTLRGARPVFADVDPDSQNITPATVRAVLSRRTKAIIAVHLAGWPCEMDGRWSSRASTVSSSSRTARRRWAPSTGAGRSAASATSRPSRFARTRSSPPVAKAAC